MTAFGFTVLRGRPDDEELAALTVALRLLAEKPRTEAVQPDPRPGWTRPAYEPPGAWSR
ncbi:Acyl-CoA carboxylase epsilon subunit [Amycolatopsis xylanica]|uniref:Acyl-CoA carboxylase epsilon subunit n=1 Tax=Amycolatopsis xylanica TaxID=589385 RepID=A0A1H2VUW1_9PSEU|nr:acyl-CoA carboxylase subunit epsilon [Amycolatopsis xylanica]SDW72011.1 Acyl-CoA carboxylase epsilon subunit [Amycolatopsis xylanica]